MDFDGWQEREKRRNRRLIFQPNWREDATFKQRPKKDRTSPTSAKESAQSTAAEEKHLQEDDPTLFDDQRS
jgi:hypothetical protein